jgi:hypothetical protein
MAEGLQATDVRHLRPILNEWLSSELQPVLGYRYYRPEYHVECAIEPQHTRLTCETHLLATIQPSLMRIDATLNYNVEFSAIDRFQLLVPTSVGDDVPISGQDIKEKTPDQGKTQDGLTSWTVRLQRRVIGPYQLRVSFDTDLPESEASESVGVTLPYIRAAGVARKTGYIPVSRGENLEVRVKEAIELEPRDIKKLPVGLASGSLGFSFFDSEHRQLKLELIRHKLESVLGAVIRRMHIETILSRQRELVHEVYLEVQNNREQYLQLKLPAGTKIWSAFVRGQPTRSTTRQSDGARLIELAQSETLDTAYRVRLILRQTLDGGDLGVTGKLGFDAIEPLNIPVLRTTWKMFLPPGYRYMGFGGSMRLGKGGGAPWIEPAAEKLLNDIPARIAGGIATPTLHPQQAFAPLNYDPAETEAEKQARLKGVALKIPLVRERLQSHFSKLSGTGDISFNYWKRKPLVLVQAFFGLILLAGLVIYMLAGQNIYHVLYVFIGFFILASLTEGLPGRLSATAMVAALAALMIAMFMHVIRLHRQEKES